MNLLATAIRLYQKSPAVNIAVRLSVRAHHKLTPGGTRAACPFPGQCSSTGLAAANAMGMAALPAIVSRMRACAPRAEDGPRCGIGDFASVDPCNAMPHPMDGGGGCH
jgi:putative component of membrane protein insertase Oxa1/YidC/SpoIIIJ protein YidD